MERSPKAVMVSTLVALLVMSAGLVGYRESFDFLSGFRVDTQSESGQNMIAEAFGPGEITPATVYVTAEDSISPLRWTVIGLELADLDGVARLGDRTMMKAGGTTAAFDVVFTDNPHCPTALDRVETLTQTTQNAAATAGITNADVLVGRDSAHTADIRAQRSTATPG